MSDVRLMRLMRRAVGRIAPPLDGLTVLTEVGSGPFVSTPLMAALAGARKTIAVTRDSRFGSADEIIERGSSLAETLGVTERVEFRTSAPCDSASEADVVTNLGFLRPLDREFVERMRTGAVIALMWEPWEFRPDDIDLAACRSRSIPVIGTNERDSRLRTFEHVGTLAVKLLLERQVEILGCDIAVVGSDPFGTVVCHVLERMGATVSRLGSGVKPPHAPDAIVLVEHRDHDHVLIGPSGIDPAWLSDNAVEIIHICGPVDDAKMRTAGLAKFPPREVAPGYMTVTTGHVGPKPVIDLHCAGLAVGGITAQAIRSGRTPSQAIEAAVASGLALSLEL